MIANVPRVFEEYKRSAERTVFNARSAVEDFSVDIVRFVGIGTNKVMPNGFLEKFLGLTEVSPIDMVLQLKSTHGKTSAIHYSALVL